MTTVERTILVQLLHDTEYTKRVLPFIQPEYFQNEVERNIFQTIKDFVDQYHTSPSSAAVQLQLQNSGKLSEQSFKAATALVTELEQDKPLDATQDAWLIKTTETFCQEKALYGSIIRAITIMESEPHSKHDIPRVLQDALAISFETHIGHDWMENAEARYDRTHSIAKKIPFAIDLFNKITKGGLEPKTLNVLMAGTAVGKSLVLCDFAAAAIMQGKNVLYFTLEMAEEKIGQRIDANLLNLPINQFEQMPKGNFITAMERLKQNHTVGKLIIKEFPPTAAHAGHFRNIIKELYLKKKFKADVIIVDYLNLCASTRFKAGGQSVNSYTYIKAIAEEIRGLAVEENLPILTATQTNRTGYASSDPGLEDTSESFGLPMTADLMVALITSEDLDRSNLLLVKQLKNRYNDVNDPRRFAVSIDKSKMRLTNAPQEAQTKIQNPEEDDEDGQVSQNAPPVKSFKTKNKAPQSYGGIR
jgi:replicative DNA helicase